MRDDLPAPDSRPQANRLRLQGDLGPNVETPRVHATELRNFWRCSERRFACARRYCPYPRSSFVTLVMW